MAHSLTNVLTIDDDATILSAYESILIPSRKTSLENALLELETLHDVESSVIDSGDRLLNFNLFQANNGLDGVEIFRRKHEEGSPIPVCIVDMRMPNGIDGLETSLHLKQIDPDVHIIIATAYSDRSNKEILSSLKSNIYYIRKPFNIEEIYQLVYSLSISYDATKTIRRLNHDLELRVENEIEKNRQKDSLLFQQAKLAAMGEMIGNIAHQWRQPLNVISMMFQLLDRQYRHKTLTDQKMVEIRDKAINTINYMSQTIDDFRGYFEPSKEKVTYSIPTLIKNTVSLIDASFALENIKIRICVESDIPHHGHPEHLKQVLVNLLNNAKDAIKANDLKEGIIRFDIAIRTPDEASIVLCDNGGGIDPRYIEKIFEPYFTTKHKSQGTGIGLYMSKRIIEECLKGSLQVENGHEGACFTILLPLNTLSKEP